MGLHSSCLGLGFTFNKEEYVQVSRDSEREREKERVRQIVERGSLIIDKDKRRRRRQEWLRETNRRGDEERKRWGEGEKGRERVERERGERDLGEGHIE
jgi:hypothetical protein